MDLPVEVRVPGVQNNLAPSRPQRKRSRNFALDITPVPLTLK